MEDNPRIAVCISTWNRLESLKKCIECVKTQFYDQELIKIYIIDNASTDGTREYLINQILYDHVAYGKTNLCCKFLDKPNPNAVQTINMALRMGYESGSKYSVVLDDDAFMDDPLTLITMVDVMSHVNNIAICGAKIVSPLQPQTESHPLFGLNHLKILSNEYVTNYSNFYKCPNFWGACAMFNNRIIGPEFYDESYELYWNEPDLAVRTVARGYDVVVLNIYPVRHGVEESRPKMRSLHYGVRNCMRFSNKYLSFRQRFCILPSLTIRELYNIFENRKELIKTSSDLKYLFKLLYAIVVENIRIFKPNKYNNEQVSDRYFWSIMTGVLNSIVTHHKI